MELVVLVVALALAQSSVSIRLADKLLINESIIFTNIQTTINFVILSKLGLSNVKGEGSFHIEISYRQIENNMINDINMSLNITDKDV
ncbi:hypothetical protein H8356DRAFT_1427775 [Neocallimastix lanati (nom. inval.)]|nr:hypothetical protein H8356DRAFT_1427775 [Neocallimastix sp. JGI-2020a]